MDHQDLIAEIYGWRDELCRTRSGIEIACAIEDRIKSETDDVKRRILNFLLAKELETLGEHAAAEVKYQLDPIDEVYFWYEELRQKSSGVDVIHAVEQRIDSEADPAKRRELSFILAQEYKQESDYAASEAIYLQLFEAEPDDPTALIKLAEQKLYFERQPKAAMGIIDRAIEVAYRSGNFRRNALGVRARIALAMKDYEIVEGVLKKIMQLGYERGNMDIGIMRDSFDRLPPGSIDPELARQYDEHCREGDCY